MHKDDLHNAYSSLISKYLSGNASSAEVEELETWVSADASNKKYFQEMKKAWMLSGLEREEQKVDVEAIWQATSREIFEEAKVLDLQSKSRSRLWLSLAAAVVILLVLGVWLLQRPQVEMQRYVTAQEVQNIDLSDGSRIALNQSSSLTYMPPTDELQQRNVKLSGDAFFEVARNETQAFLIQAEDVEVEVLGTSFYVDAREDQDEVQVSVSSGRVAVRAAGKEQILGPNERAVFQKESQALLKDRHTDTNLLSLKTQKFVFEGTPLEEVVFTLSRHFHADIRILDQPLKKCLYSGTHEQQSLQAILSIIEGALGIKVQAQGKRFILSGTCNGENL